MGWVAGGRKALGSGVVVGEVGDGWEYEWELGVGVR